MSKNAHTILNDFKQDFSLLVLHINIRSLAANFAKLQILISSLKVKPHVISINETWLKQNQQGDYSSLFDYKLVSNSRNEHKEGGVALYIQRDLSFSVQDDLTIMKEKVFESLFVDIHFNKKESITVGTIYRSPQNDVKTHHDFLDNLTHVFDSITNSRSHCIILGDMNYNLLDCENSKVHGFVDTMYENGFYSVVSKPTRITSHQLCYSNRPCLDKYA